MKRLIFVIVAGTIAATGEAALADLSLQPEPGKPNHQLTPVSIPGESPPQLPKEEQLEIPQVELLKLEVSQQLPSDQLINRTLINRTLRFEFGVE
jgi:hypothetical protein